MDIYKIIGIAIIGLFFSCCDMLPSRKYDDLLEKYTELKEASNMANEDVVRQYKNINQILQKLESISGRIFLVHQDIEGVRLSEVEMINTLLESVSNELDEARKKTDRGEMPELYKTIGHLQTMLREKQEEIVYLEHQIIIRDQRIEDLGEVIIEGEQTIKRQSHIIEQQLDHIQQMQMNAWYDMGIELYAIFKEYHDISGGFLSGNKKNKARMAENKRNILSKALNCFQEAMALGHPNASIEMEAANKELNKI